MTHFLFERMFFIDILLVGFIATIKLPKRSHFALRLPVSVAACALLSCGWSAVFGSVEPSNFGLSILSYLVSFSIAMLTLWTCVQISGWSLLYISTTAWFVQHSTVCLEFLIFRSTNTSLLTFWIHISLVLVAALIVYALFLRKLESYILDRLRLHQVAPIWLIMCIICLVLSAYVSMAREGTVSFYLADLLCNIVGLLYQYSLYQISGLAREKESMQLLLNQSKKQYETAKDNMERVNIKCHDLRHQINLFRREGHVNEQALKEMEAAVNDYDATVRTANTALDVILTEKRTLCASKHIGFTCMAEGSGISYMEPADLYALFGNALDNAIEAADQLQDDVRKQIALTVRRVGEFCSIHLQNYTDGQLVLVDGLPVTSKKDKYNHGFGVRSMRMLVEKYHGEIMFQQEDDVVDLYLLLPCENKAADSPK